MKSSQIPSFILYELFVTIFKIVRIREKEMNDVEMLLMFLVFLPLHSPLSDIVVSLNLTAY